MSDDTKEWLASEALRLGNEVRDLSISNAVLRDDNAELKDENEELHKDYESLADEHTKLIDRNKTLKDELRKRALDSLSDIGQLGEQSAEIACLKAEVERLTSEVSYDNRVQLHVDKLAGEFTQAEVERLKAEVERLRKAGDAVCESPYLLESDPAVIAWRAAKEGKQS